MSPRLRRLRAAAVAAVLASSLLAPAGSAGADLNGSFGTSGRHLDPLAGGTQVAVRPDGRVVGVGTMPTIGDFQITQLDSTGSPDQSFGDPGTPGKKLVNVPLPVYSDDIFGPMGVGVVNDGDLVTIFSSDIGAMLVRTNPDGTLDTGYSGDGVLDHLACGNAIDGEVADDGTAVVLGYPMDFQQNNAECDGTVIRRYTPTGFHDSGWGNQGRNGVSLNGAHFDDRMYPSAIDLRGTGDVVVAGSTSDGSRIASLIRVSGGNALNSFGSAGFVAFDPDPNGAYAAFQSFGNGAVGSFTQGHGTKQAMDVAFDAFDNVVTVGTTCASADNALNCTAQTGVWVARHRSDGSFDPSFGNGGVVHLDPTSDNDYGLTVEVLPSGKIAVGGFTGPDPLKQFVTVLEIDGSVRADFGGGNAIIGGFGAPASENQQPLDMASAGDRVYVSASRFDPSQFGYGSHISAYDFSANAIGGFNPVSPTRVLDTRQSGQGGLLAPGETRTISVTGTGSIPSSGVKAVALSLTAVSPTTAGYLTLFPANAARPNTSAINFAAGEVVANGLTIGVESGTGEVKIYNSHGNTHVVVDVMGWFADWSAFTPTAPFRAMDTRDGTGGFNRLIAGQTVHLDVTGSGGVPNSGVAAVAVNITAVTPSAAGFLTAFPSGQARPTASALNFTANDVQGNASMVGVGSNGRLAIYNPTGTTDVVVDVMGWYSNSGEYQAISPSRVADTRLGLAGAILAPGESRVIDVDASGVVPSSGVKAVSVNLTAVTPTAAGYLTAWPSDTTQPLASALNFAASDVVANGVIVGIDGQGRMTLFNPSGSTHVVADVTGYFPD